jgi:hypothetical protein
MVDRLAIEQHAAVGLADKAGHDPKQRRLSATGGAQQSNEFAACDVEIDIALRGEVIEPLRYVIEGKPVTTIRRHLKARNLRFNRPVTIAWKRGGVNTSSALLGLNVPRYPKLICHHARPIGDLDHGWRGLKGLSCNLYFAGRRDQGRLTASGR